MLLLYGGTIVTAFKQRALPGQKVLADTKIVDAGRLESELLFDQGADIVTVLGGSDNTTIELALEAAARRGKEIMIDLIDVHDKAERLKQLVKMGVGGVCLHRPSDVSHTAVLELDYLPPNPRPYEVSIAGGINLHNIPEVMPVEPDILVMGSALTKACDPLEYLAEVLALIGKGK